MSDSPPDSKKPVVIHTRVNEDLDAEIRRRAQGLGVSVSNLVRNILQHTFGLVGDIVADSKIIARSAKTGAPAPVLGWQPATLAVNAVCAHCNDILKKGTPAAISIPPGNGFLCATCLKELEHASHD